MRLGVPKHARTGILLALTAITLLGGARVFEKYLPDMKEEKALEAARSAAARAVLSDALRGEWAGEDGVLLLSGDNQFRESVSKRIAETKAGLSYSFRLGYVVSGRWRVDMQGLSQEVTDVTQVAVTEIEASWSSVKTTDQAAFLRNFQDELASSVPQNLRRELVGKTFVTEPGFPSSDTLILKGSNKARRYSRVQ